MPGAEGARAESDGADEGYDTSSVNATPNLFAIVASGSMPSSGIIDFYATRFLDLEARTSEAYNVALSIDQPYEELKRQLIHAVDELGVVQGPYSKLLRGLAYEIQVTHCHSVTPDPTAVRSFAKLLRRNGLRGLFPDVFETVIDWRLRHNAEEHLQKVKLPPELQELYEKCKRLESTATL
jgi:hypothetical protein